jgi:predicted amidophosphoribosyltransferase
VEPSFLVCPVCTTKLKQACRNCQAPLEALWQVCPYCEAPIETPASLELGRTQRALQPPRRERRRAE